MTRLALAVLALLSASPPAHAAAPTPYFELCAPGHYQTCVVDGDTVRINYRRIRLEGIDAPETHPSRCPAEQALGDRATLRLQALLNAGGWVETTNGYDIYGRILARFVAADRDLGDELVSEGLARPYRGHREPWC